MLNLFFYFFLYHLKYFNICIHLYALLWNDEKLWCAAPLRKKGSDDNYLARYDKIIVTRSIFIFRFYFFLLFPSTLQCPSSFHHRKDYEWWCNFSPPYSSQEVSIEKQFFTSSKYYKLLSRWNAGGVRSFKKPKLSEDRNKLSRISLIFFFCATQFTGFFGTN